MGLNLSPEQINNLMAMASKKMGISQEELKQKIERGDFNKAFGLGNLNDAASVNQLLGNKEVQENLKKNPQLMNMINKLMGGK